MKSKKQIIQTGIMVSTMAVSFVGNMETGFAYNRVNLQAKQTLAAVKASATQINQLAIDFVNHNNPNNFKAWDQRLAPMSDKEASEIKAFMDSEIIKGETNDLNKAKLIYEWIVKNIKYASPQDTQVGLTPYEVFTYKVAVCGGYSNLYKAMLNLAEIPAIVVTGDTYAGAHAWNLVYANGKWFYSDSTWGSSSPKYFNSSVEEFSKDHTVKQLQKVYATENDMSFSFYESGVAFEGVKRGVTRVNVPNTFKDLNVTVVSPSIFESSNIEYLNLGKNIASFDYKTASENMNFLKEIVVDENNSVYASRDGVLFSKDFSKLLVYPMAKQNKTFTLPVQTTTYDQKETFNNKNLTFIDVEKDNPAYSSYDGVIYNKNKSAILTIPEGKDRINVLGSAILDNIAFGFKENLKTIMLEEGITGIPSYTFNGCNGLKEMYIPKTVINIGDDAFFGVNYKQFTIFGEKGSAAEQFAKAKGIAFVNVSEKVEELNLLISKAKSLPTENVQANLIKELNDSISVGESLLGKNNITVPEIEEAIKKLSLAIKNVELDKTELQNLVNQAITDFDPYTEESVNFYKEAVNKATDVLENKNATKEEIQEAVHALKTAALVKKVYTVVIDGKVVTVVHGEKVNAPKNPIKEGFTFIGWYIGNDVYDFSKPVKGNLIIEARFTKNEETKVVDKTELQNLVNHAVTNFDGYTTESVEAYKEALNFAQEVLENESATEDEVVMAIQGLEKAVLVKSEESVDQDSDDNYKPELKPESSTNQNEKPDNSIEEDAHSNVPNTGVGIAMNQFAVMLGTAMAGIYASMRKAKK